MSAHPPPVPPEQRNQQGAATQDAPERPAQDPNLAEQGRQGNVKQNTTNRGLQQDR